MGEKLEPRLYEKSPSADPGMPERHGGLLKNSIDDNGPERILPASKRTAWGSLAKGTALFDSAVRPRLVRDAV